MNIAAEVLSRVLRVTLEQVVSGKASALAKSAFYISVSVLSVTVSQSVPEIKSSIIELNQKIAVLIERTEWQGTEIKRHDEMIAKQWHEIEKIWMLEKRSKKQGEIK